jgi:hypothetical protein
MPLKKIKPFFLNGKASFSPATLVKHSMDDLYPMASGVKLVVKAKKW